VTSAARAMLSAWRRSTPFARDIVLILLVKVVLLALLFQVLPGHHGR
jgi:hypothetical protein